MSMQLNGVEITELHFNGNEVNSLWFNGAEVWSGIYRTVAGVTTVISAYSPYTAGVSGYATKNAWTFTGGDGSTVNFKVSTQNNYAAYSTEHGTQYNHYPGYSRVLVNGVSVASVYKAPHHHTRAVNNNHVWSADVEVTLNQGDVIEFQRYNQGITTPLRYGYCYIKTDNGSGNDAQYFT